MKEKTIVSAFTLTASMVSYFYAKAEQKDTVPYVMIGGFLGAVLGEMIADAIRDSKGNNSK